MHKYNPEHLERLLSAERYKNIAPEALLRKAGLKSGDVFADVGCGPGFFTAPAARIVGSSGKAFAVDTEERMIEALRGTSPPPNVIPVKSEEYRIPIDAKAVDFALLAYVLHETEDKVRFLKEIRRIIRPGGRFLVIDWKKKTEEHGPPRQERLSIKTSMGLLKEAGFASIKASSLNPSHYFILALKP